MNRINSSRQTIAAGQRNCNLKVAPVVIEGRKALVVKIDWTDAPVIKTTVRRDFKLSVLAKDTKTWANIQRGLMFLKAGQVIHYTQSAEHPGWYYVTIVGQSCTCTAGLYKQECHHQKDAVAFEITRVVGPAYTEEVRRWNALSQGERDALLEAAVA